MGVRFKVEGKGKVGLRVGGGEKNPLAGIRLRDILP